MAMVDGLIFGWKKNLDYGQRLVEDLTNEQMSIQLVESGLPANHPAWVYSHLNVYIPIIQKLILGEAFEDPKGHRFGMQSKPESDGSIYAGKDILLQEFVSGHERVIELLEEKGDACLEQEVQLERWRGPMPTTGVALPYLMLVHENQHFGQISAWRRVQGMPSV